MCEAAAAGDVRAITGRFWTAADGRAMLPRVAAAPTKLCRVGEKPGLLVTLVFRSDAAVTCVAPRLIAWPFTNALRDASVTAAGLCAFTKFTLLIFLEFSTLTLTIVVFRTLMTFTNLGLQWNHGKNGSPNPSGNQPTPAPKPNPPP